jgi:tRNA threonylcarbamoyl adenosine modification protein YjeE
MTINITHLDDLRRFATEFVTQLQPGDVYGLQGELGAGKTTFVKQVARQLGITTDVISPTFIYHQTYTLPEPVRGIERFHHFDLYRLASDADVDQLGLEFDDLAGIHLVEWIDHAPELARRATQVLEFDLKPSGERSVIRRSFDGVNPPQSPFTQRGKFPSFAPPAGGDGLGEI